MTETTTGPVSRADLLALTPDTLSALANRGLVKRATKELDAGTAPSLTTEPDTTVRARFDDGITAVLPPGVGLDKGSCSCAAPGVCRHLVALVLAYQRDAGAGADGAPVPVPVTDWSPAPPTTVRWPMLSAPAHSPRPVAPSSVVTAPWCTAPRPSVRSPGSSCPPVRCGSRCPARSRTR